MSVVLKTRLREVLSEREMTQKQLAELAGLRENTVSEIAKNQRDTLNRYHLAKIADVLNIKDLNELLTIEEE